MIVSVISQETLIVVDSSLILIPFQYLNVGHINREFDENFHYYYSHSLTTTLT